MKARAKRRTPKPVKGFAASPDRRRIVRRAHADLAQGQENTDCRRPDRTSRKHCP